MMRLCDVAFILMLCPTWCVAAERYAAMFADGSRAEEAEVRDWCEPTSQAKLAGRVLFDSTVPVRWIIDRDQPPVPKPPFYVEFVGGDVLAGEVTAYWGGQENPYEIQPPHLVVKPAFLVQPPEATAPADLRVTIEWIQRIVWDHVGADQYRPGTLWLRTGVSISFRSLRWTSSGVIVLTNDGVKQFPISELGEVHLPRLDQWTAYYEQLSVLSPAVTSRLIQINGQDGSRFTTSVERFQSRHQGDRNRPEQWFQLIQPAWSLDSIWLRYRTIRAWRFFSPNEIPLSNFSPVQVTHQAVFGQGLDWQIDQNVLRGPLQSSDQEFGWGFGVHGTSQLVFELPETARAMRTRFGLDKTAGTGGCVNVEILVGGGQSLIKQTNLIGAQSVREVEWLPLPAVPADHCRVTLRTEMAHESRPAGADPFDVRDLLNWYEPEIRLDQTSLDAEVSKRSVARVAGLIGWTISAEDSKLLKVANIVDASDPRDPRYRMVIRSAGRSYTLSRKVKVGARDRWLAIVASRFAENSSSTTMQVQVEGRGPSEFELPIRQSMTDPAPMLISVEPFQGRTVTVAIIVTPTDDESWVDWRGLSIGPERPGLLTIFEDDERFATVLQRGTGRVEIDTDKPYSGTRSLKVTPGAGHNAMIPDLDALICEFPRLGQYRYLVFAWKKSTGTRIQIQLANRGRLGDAGPLPAVENQQAGPARLLSRLLTVDDRGRRFGYCYEQGVATTQPPIPLWMNGNLPRAWQLIQRDLFNDFGLFSVTGVSLNCVDGEAAWFDHLYLARTKEDLDYAETLLVNPQHARPQTDPTVDITQ